MPTTLRSSVLLFGVCLAKKIVVTTATVSMFRIAPGVDVALAATLSRVDDAHGKLGTTLALPHCGISSASAVAAVRAALPPDAKPIGGQAEAIQMVWQDEHGKYYMTYRVRLTTQNPHGDWEAIVDANSGSILHIQNQALCKSQRTICTCFDVGIVIGDAPRCASTFCRMSLRVDACQV